MTIEHVIRAIRQAFSLVDWVGTSLRQFILIDDYGISGGLPDGEYEQAEKEWHDAKGEGRICTWQDIPHEMLGEREPLLAHMQSDEYLFYLPAYMVYALEKYKSKKDFWLGSETIDWLLWGLTFPDDDEDRKAYTIEQYRKINSQQAEAIVLFLELVKTLAQEEDDCQRKNDAECALNYWRKRAERDVW